MKPRPVEWNPERVTNFWDFTARKKDPSSYFGYQVGRGVSNFLSHAVALTGAEVLDFGSGPGHLIEHLLNAGAVVSAADYSADSVQAVAAAFGDRKSFKAAASLEGGRLPWPEKSFDAVVCLETIEHVLTQDLEGVLSEILRVLKPGGIALFTTPNDEDLDASMICCPSCLTEFHRWQHVRSWDAESLKARLSRSGYETIFCQALNILRFQPRPVGWRHYSFQHARNALKRSLLEVLDRLAPRPFPRGRVFRSRFEDSSRANLIAVARRPESER